MVPGGNLRRKLCALLHSAASKAIFFPVINAECSEVEEVAVGNPIPTAEEMRACADFLIDHVTETEASIDGRPVNSQRIGRVQSPLFSFTLPEDNILGIEDPDPNPSLAVSDGFWLFLSPLSVGEHVIHFRGVAPFPEFGFTFETEVTYFLTVVDD